MWAMAGAVAICAAFAALEGLAAGKDVPGFLRRLRQPRWSPPLPVWIGIGAAYYALCAASLAVLLGEGLSAPLILLLLVMTANAAWNLVFFRQRAFGLATAFMAGYAALVTAFAVTFGDRQAAVTAALALYGAYLVYVTAWSLAVWRLNR